MHRSLAIVAALTAVAGCAPTGETGPGQGMGPSDRGGRQCFDPSRIVNFAAGDVQRLYVRTMNGEVFRINSASCVDTGLTPSLSITPTDGIGSRLCEGDGVEIAVPNPSFGPGRCRAQVDRVLTQAEVAALPGRERP